MTNNIWEISVSYKDGMRVPARIFSSDKLIGGIDSKIIDQISNVACLPGIQKFACCMPDGHVGYGFPIGGVAAFSTGDGVISPGGIGFDINCGMRLLRTNLTLGEIEPKKEELLNRLFQTIPSGVGSKGFVSLSRPTFNELMEKGLGWCIDNGYATDSDRDYVEDRGYLEQADSKTISEKAISRGINQMGTLGSGNHYLEIEVLAPNDIFNKEVADVYGLDRDNQVVIAIHCGSRGFGHQIATDYLKLFGKCIRKYDLHIRDSELMAAPIKSAEGQQYFSAMACAANAAFVNRQLIVFGIRKVFKALFGKSDSELGITTIYDVAHNIAKLEKYNIGGYETELLVHRKGATRSFGPGHHELPEKYRTVGQPVIVGGSMETGSALLCGAIKSDQEAFGSSLHGAGRTMSRIKAKKSIKGEEVRQRMKKGGILVKTGYISGLAEEASFAYKDIDSVIDAVDALGLSSKVARFRPVLNIKG